MKIPTEIANNTTAIPTEIAVRLNFCFFCSFFLTSSAKRTSASSSVLGKALSIISMNLSIMLLSFSISNCNGFDLANFTKSAFSNTHLNFSSSSLLMNIFFSEMAFFNAAINSLDVLSIAGTLTDSSIYVRAMSVISE